MGAIHLGPDATTATRPGAWASLAFEMVTIPGRDNTLGMPVFILPLNWPNGIHVSETAGGTVTIPCIPGFALKVAPGSATFPNGSREGGVSVTLVHADKVPMVPNFAQQPRMVITVQPPGVLFDPPARVTYPNLDGGAPGATVELYSFDHDMGRFVTSGTATVSEDTLTVTADAGSGIGKGGWQCAGTSAVPPTGQCVNVQAPITPPQLDMFVGEELELPSTGNVTPGNPAYLWSVTDEEKLSFAFAPSNDTQTHPANTIIVTALKETPDQAEGASVTFTSDPRAL